MINVSEAKELIDKSIVPLAPKTFVLLQVSGKVLAEDVWATIDIPAFEQSSVDGYAIKFADKDSWMKINGEIAAGTSQYLSIKQSEAARIFMGAPLPQGADTVGMQEKVQVENGQLSIKDATLRQGGNVRGKGAEIKAGCLAVRKGTVLLCCTLSLGQVEV